MISVQKVDKFDLLRILRKNGWEDEAQLDVSPQAGSE